MQVQTVTAMFTLAVMPATRGSHTPPSVRSRDGACTHPGSRTTPLVPVAIDSETGEPCCVNARQAGLLKPAQEALRPSQLSKKRNGSPD